MVLPILVGLCPHDGHHEKSNLCCALQTEVKRGVCSAQRFTIIAHKERFPCSFHRFAQVLLFSCPSGAHGHDSEISRHRQQCTEFVVGTSRSLTPNAGLHTPASCPKFLGTTQNSLCVIQSIRAATMRKVPVWKSPTAKSHAKSCSSGSATRDLVFASMLLDCTHACLVYGSSGYSCNPGSTASSRAKNISGFLSGRKSPLGGRCLCCGELWRTAPMMACSQFEA